ncbi:MAG: hypothetical protein SCM96_05295 [Acidobacteriota bacterium]|nr:hypothetical protein [Acidobacteriota bacterium]
MEKPSVLGTGGNKKTDRLVSFLKIISDTIWYAGLGLAAIFLAALILTAFPEFAQGKISMPLQVDIRNPDARILQEKSVAGLDQADPMAASIICSTQDLFMIRVLLSYRLAVMLGICAALFFWRRILKSSREPDFFTKRNRSTAASLGWLLVAYIPLHEGAVLIAESLMDLRISRGDLATSLGSGYNPGITLAILGLLFLFLSRVMEKSEKAWNESPVGMS